MSYLLFVKALNSADYRRVVVDLDLGFTRTVPPFPTRGQAHFERGEAGPDFDLKL